MQTQQTKKVEALAAIGLSAFGAYSIATTPIAYRGQGISLLLMVAGAGAIVSAIGIQIEGRLQLADYAAGLEYAVANFRLCFRGGAGRWLKRISLQRLPAPIKSSLETFRDRAIADSSWLKRLACKSHLVGGVTNDGKTMFLQWEVVKFLEHYPNGELRICDIDYGKRENYWLDLPLGSFVFMELEDFVALVDRAWSEMEQRRQAVRDRDRSHHFQPWLLVVDELNQTLRGIETKMPDLYKDAWAKIQDLIFRGHGYKIFFVGGVHTLAVGTAKFTEAERRQLNAVLLGTLAVEGAEVTRLAGAHHSNDLIARVQRLRRLPGGKYACIARIEGEGTQVQIVPHIDFDDIQISLPADSLAPEQHWANALPWNEIGQKKTSGQTLTALWGEYGQGRQGESNPHYQAFRELWRSL